MELITDKVKLGKAIAAIAKTVKGLDDQLHIVACSCLSHYVEHGDSTYLTKLCKAVSEYTVKDGKAKWNGKSVRGAALRKWIEDFAPLNWSTSDEIDGNGGYKTKKSGKPKDTRLSDAMAIPFYDYVEDHIREFKPIDEAKSLRERAKKLLTNGKSDSGKTTLSKEQVISTRNLIAALDDFVRREAGLDFATKTGGNVESIVNDDSTVGHATGSDEAKAS